MMQRFVAIALLVTVAGLGLVACSGEAETATTTTTPSAPSSIEAVCALNEDFEELNERTLAVIPETGEEEPIPVTYAGLLEENYVEGVKLMRQMVDHVPEAMRDDLSAYTRAIGKLSEMYAEYGYDQAATWENADYATFFREYEVPEEVRTGIKEWFMANCGMDLQG